ncbi:protein of unknown function [Bradyrhizobium vignae]|uniref:Uncharacterized protein n=1 Tax=Bradyrhizobium vignae TaxID=1549949 RepID=A0A2U3Q9L6_9BRAD|nr:protein of unknown function [Bradyrhizobium vignae]
MVLKEMGLPPLTPVLTSWDFMIPGLRAAIDGRTTRHGGYAVSQRSANCIEEASGWIKTVADKRSPASVAVGPSDGPLPLLLAPTIWCGCPS